MESPDYHFERLNSNNIKDLPKIYQAAFGMSETVEHFIKKNNTQFSGVSNLGFIAYSNLGEPAAFYCAYTCVISYKGQHYKAAQIGDAMTHPNHQRKGLFNSLSQLTHSTALKEGIPYLFTFPNKSANSYPAFIKQQWTETGGWQSYVIRVRGISYQSIRKFIPVGNKIYQLYSQFILNRLPQSRESFKNSIIDDVTGGVERSSDFLNYKTYTQNFCIKIKKKIIWVKIKGNTLLIGDMEHCDPKTFNSIINRLKFIALILGLGYIEFKCSSGIQIEKLFDKVKSWKLDNTQTAILYLKLQESFPGDSIKFTIADDDTF